MIVGKQNILSYFDHATRPFFKVYKMGTAGAGNTVFESGEEENLTLEDSRQAFEKWLNLQSVGRFELHLSAGAKFPSKGKLIQPFEIPFNEISVPAVVSQSAPVVAGFPIDPAAEEARIEKKADERLQMHLTKWELDKLKDENASLKKEIKDLEKQTGGIGSVFEKLQPHLGSIISLFKPGTPAVQANTALVAGLDDDGEGPAPDTVRLTKVLQVFARHDKDFLTTLERVAVKIDAEPGTWELIKSML